jgi:hypothetical protein
MAKRSLSLATAPIPKWPAHDVDNIFPELRQDRAEALADDLMRLAEGDDRILLIAAEVALPVVMTKRPEDYFPRADAADWFVDRLFRNSRAFVSAVEDWERCLADPKARNRYFDELSARDYIRQGGIIQ